MASCCYDYFKVGDESIKVCKNKPRNREAAAQLQISDWQMEVSMVMSFDWQITVTMVR